MRFWLACVWGVWDELSYNITAVFAEQPAKYGCSPRISAFAMLRAPNLSDVRVVPLPDTYGCHRAKPLTAIPGP
jgi:hypothetical protein